MVMDERLLTVADVAQRLHVSMRTIRRLMATEKMPHYRIGRCVRFSANEVREWLSQLQAER